MQNHTQTHNDLKDDSVVQLHLMEPEKGILTVGDLQMYLTHFDKDMPLIIRMVDQRRFVKHPIADGSLVLGSVGY